MKKIVLIRHGESEWNKKNLFTGWTDVGLTDRGIKEATDAGEKLLKEGYKFDIAFTSYLKRASRTLDLVLQKMWNENIEIDVDWRLNERHYGNLQGLNKKETAEKFGEDQLLIWRRSYSVRPPSIEPENNYNQENDPKYKDIVVPKSESLEDVVERVRLFWEEKIIPELKKDKNIIIAASGNSLRALVKYLDGISEDDIVSLNIPTGIPLIYELDENLSPIKNYYLAESSKLQDEINKVANQGK